MILPILLLLVGPFIAGLGVGLWVGPVVFYMQGNKWNWEYVIGALILGPLWWRFMKDDIANSRGKSCGYSQPGSSAPP